ncbi:MAG: TonB-dependent receptor [Flavobacteriales bacterium]|nr:TonB-dependent receptor [Flavobacteriales bacterium]
MIRIQMLLISLFLCTTTQGQNATLHGKIISGSQALEYAVVSIKGTALGCMSDSAGRYILGGLPAGQHVIMVQSIGYISVEKKINISAGQNTQIDFDLIDDGHTTDEVVISATMKEVSRLDCPVAVEVYSAQFFKSNPTPSVFEALQNINGIRPQINCNVCNTGDIHINGLEGPYTMVLIDGMPLVSGLSTVYGLSGIPQSLIDRVEVVKGPASTLYGSEAVGGLINIITKKTANAPKFSIDVFGTSWQEWSADIATKFNAGKKAESMLGMNIYSYQNPRDNNDDQFTDVTLQQRISVFNKWNFIRKKDRIFNLAGRYVYEDRWGGDMRWTPEFRGGDSIYGESIYTSRWELFSNYELPFEEKIQFSFSANGHDQNSVYGKTKFNAQQIISFGQLTWFKNFGQHDMLFGATTRYTYYDDDTPITTTTDTAGHIINKASRSWLPGFFIQDEIHLNSQNRLLLGMRLDHHSVHGKIFTPRLNYKWSSKNNKTILRTGIGNGYRVAQVFTEDHAALTGSRQTVFLDALKPETSWNGNVNYIQKIAQRKKLQAGMDVTLFYTRFSNRIIADYTTDVNKIIYDNLHGYAISRGMSVNIDFALTNGLTALIGATYQDVFSVNDGVKKNQLFTEKWSGTWNINYNLKRLNLRIDYNGKLYSPMQLPLLSANDPRSEYSPWWSIQNIQLTKRIGKQMEIYFGIKNLLNWTPQKGNPFLIARSQDPFDKDVLFDANGQALRTSNNPYGLTFDPTYVYGPNQGMRFFAGIRYNFY